MRRRYTRRPRKYKRFTRKWSRKYKRTKVNKAHYFKRTKVSEVTITNAGFVAIQNGEHTLASFPEHEEFQALFDRYSIRGIKQRFIFNRNTAEIASASAEIPQLISVYDNSDKTVLSDEDEALQYGTFKSVRLNKPITRYFKPYTSVGNQMKRMGYYDTVQDNVDTFGLKIAVDTISSATGTTLGTLRIYTTAYIACLSPK